MKKIYSILACAMLLLTSWSCSEDTTSGPGPEEPTAPELSAQLQSAQEGTVTFTVTATEGAEVAYWFGEAAFFETVDVTPETIFRTGETITPVSFPATVTIEEANLYVANRIWIAARSNGLYSQALCLEVNPSDEDILTAGEATKTSLSYIIGNVAPDAAVSHTYIELWFYKYLHDQAVAEYGELTEEEFNRLVLANYGITSTGPRTVVWNAGDANEPRDSFAAIVGGRTYVALAAPLLNAETGQMGRAESVEINTPEPDESSARVQVTISELTPEGMLSVIDPGEDVRFFYYALFSRQTLDEFLSENTEKDLCDYLYEYGYVSANCYTDQWGFTVPGVAYVLAIYGVDMNGDTFLQQEAIEPEPYEPEIELTLTPYENEAESLYGYNTLHVSATFRYFDQIDPSTVKYLFTSKEMIDALSSGLSIEDAIQYGLFLPYAMPLSEEWSASLTAQQQFSGVLKEDPFTFSALQPQTEYCFLVMTNDPSGTEVIGAYAVAATNAEPSEEEDEGYKAYLGEWTLKGQSTEFWSPNTITYNLRVEELVTNYSYRVYGWSDADVAQTTPFVMNYDPETQQVYIQGPQDLGPYNGNDNIHLYFGGMVLGDGDNLNYVNTAPQRLFTGHLYDDSFILQGEFTEFEGRSTDYRSMNYVSVDSATPDTYSRIPGALYDAIYFNIQRAAASGTAARRNYVERPAAPAPALQSAAAGQLRHDVDPRSTRPRPRIAL